jgi:hypothetical protein
MFWKLAVSALVLPVYLGFGAVTAKAAVLQKQEVSAIASQEPQYIANNYDDCNDGYRRRNNYYRQNSYQQNSYHRSNYRPRYYQNSYQGGHNGGHNNNYGGGYNN